MLTLSGRDFSGLIRYSGSAKESAHPVDGLSRCHVSTHMGTYLKTPSDTGVFASVLKGWSRTPKLGDTLEQSESDST